MKHVIEKEGGKKISGCLKSYSNPHMLRKRLATGWKKGLWLFSSVSWMMQQL